MYSIVLMAAMTAAPDVPQDFLCPVSPSRYTGGILSHHFNGRCFYDCCMPARYGWVNCHTKGFGWYPGSGCCTPSYGHFWHGVGACGIATCGAYGTHCGQGGWGCSRHDWCGFDWGIGVKPAYWPSNGCYPGGYAPYAGPAPQTSCGCYGGYAFDSGLVGHSHGIGYAGFSGYGNFGFYGAVPMTHPPTTADIPRFNPPQQPEYRSPIGVGGVPSTTPATGTFPLPQIPANVPVPGGTGLPPIVPPTPTGGAVPFEPPAAPKEERKEKPISAPASVFVSVPAGAKVFVESYQLKSEGRERAFKTPSLESGRNYTYQVKATVTIGGKEHSETKSVSVTAGQSSRISFNELIAKVDASVPALAGGR